MIDLQKTIEEEIAAGVEHMTPPDYARITIPHRYHLIAMNGGHLAFLYRDGEYFLVNDLLPRMLERYDGMAMTSIITRNDWYLVLHYPIPLDDISEWPAYAKELWHGIVCRKVSAV
jgi:hypothetical protein